MDTDNKNEQSKITPFRAGVWDADLYDNKHSFVTKYGEDVMGWLAPQKDEHILDVGCGTGTLTGKIAETGAIVTGIDASPEMITKAKQAYNNIEFFVKDASNFSFARKFDAAFSNATFHWIKDQQAALQCIYDSLKTGGRLVYEMGAKHNIESIHKAVIKVMIDEGFEENTNIELNYFSSAAEQAVILEKIGYTISNIIQFNRPTELVGEDGMKNWIVQFCQPLFKDIPAEKVENIIDKAVAILKETNYENGKWYADYIRLRVKAVKE
ncbi:MAG: class I SAM-dependent methyltransferase [Parafilimonas sp.]